MDPSKFGIYLNKKESRVVRINSPYWIPEGEEWVYLTPEVNMTLLKIRELAGAEKTGQRPRRDCLGYHSRQGLGSLQSRATL